MRILYGAVGEGLGHATRSGVAGPASARAGHEVKMVASGRAYPWSVTLWDWSKGVTADKTMPRADRQVRGGDVILLHGGCNVSMGYDRSQSVEATGRILRRWKDEGGLEFVTVPEMIERQGFVYP